MIRDWLVPPHIQALVRTARGLERRAQYKRLIRDAVNWCVPPRVQQLVLNLSYDRHGVDTAPNRALRDRHQGRRAFVIGNGPSLGAMDLTCLADEVTIGANSFYMHPDAQAARLKYLCIGDASFMEDKPNCIEWHRTIAERMPQTELLLHPTARQIIEKYLLYPGHKVYYYRRGVPTEYPEGVHYDLTQPLVVGMNTGTVLSIPLAMYLGCTKIYLIGFDANWLEGYSRSYHFYQVHQQFPEFDSMKADGRWPHYEDQLILTLRDFEGHRLLSTFAQRRGIEIHNATVGGLLDMYPRVRFEDLFPG